VVQFLPSNHTQTGNYDAMI